MFENLLFKKYPTVVKAMSKNKACVRVGEDAFLIKNSIGLADAIELYTRSKYLVGCNEDRDNVQYIRGELIKKCSDIVYPVVAWFNFSDVKFLSVNGAMRIPD